MFYNVYIEHSAEDNDYIIALNSEQISSLVDAYNKGERGIRIKGVERNIDRPKKFIIYNITDTSLGSKQDEVEQNIRRLRNISGRGKLSVKVYGEIGANVTDAILKERRQFTEERKIFISHSAIDKEKVQPLVDLLQIIGVPHDQIFFSSHPAYGVRLGENIFERLKTELQGRVFALFILSENFYKSAVCLCEMGATWIKSNKQVPILVPPFDFEDVKGVFPNSLGFRINDKDQLNSFKIEIERYFNLNPVHASHWEEKRDKYLREVNDLL